MLIPKMKNPWLHGMFCNVALVALGAMGCTNSDSENCPMGQFDNLDLGNPELQKIQSYTELQRILVYMYDDYMIVYGNSA